jgi:hypothetical protein
MRMIINPNIVPLPQKPSYRHRPQCPAGQTQSLPAGWSTFLLIGIPPRVPFIVMAAFDPTEFTQNGWTSRRGRGTHASRVSRVADEKKA